MVRTDFEANRSTEIKELTICSIKLEISARFGNYSTRPIHLYLEA